MKYTKEEKQSICKSLRAARKYIAKGQERYVCFAVERVWGCGKIGPGEATLTRKMIYDRIQPHNSVQFWLSRQPGVVIPKGPASSVEKMFQEYRLRWIDSMIEEFK